MRASRGCGRCTWTCAGRARCCTPTSIPPGAASTASTPIARLAPNARSRGGTSGCPCGSSGCWRGGWTCTATSSNTRTATAPSGRSWRVSSRPIERWSRCCKRSSGATKRTSKHGRCFAVEKHRVVRARDCRWTNSTRAARYSKPQPGARAALRTGYPESRVIPPFFFGWPPPRSPLRIRDLIMSGTELLGQHPRSHLRHVAEHGARDQRERHQEIAFDIAHPTRRREGCAAEAAGDEGQQGDLRLDDDEESDDPDEDEREITRAGGADQGHGEPHPDDSREVRRDRLLQPLHLAASGEEAGPRDDTRGHRDRKAGGEQATELDPERD